MKPTPTTILAWRVEINVASSHCIVFATTKAKAQWIAVRSYWDAYGKGNWPRPSAARAPEFDRSSLRTARQQAYSEDHVLGCTLLPS